MYSGCSQQARQCENNLLVTPYAIYWPVEESQGCLERWCGAQWGKGRGETGHDLMSQKFSANTKHDSMVAIKLFE